MPKRSKDQLTGGTGDVNPQVLTFEVTQTGTDTTTVKQNPLPIPRFPTREGQNLVFELLWIDYYWVNAAVVNNNASIGVLATVTTNPLVPASAEEAMLDPRLVDAWYKTIFNFGPIGASTGFADINAENTQDMTDSAGHGVLIASDNLYFGLLTANTTQANKMIFKIGYRMKAVSLVEYIGIVQSQQ